MCYAKSLRKKDTEILERLNDELYLNYKIPLEFTPYYHLNGFTHGNVYIIPMNEPDQIYPATWGLVPDWALHNPNKFLKKSNTLNARSESMFEKPSFKNSAESKRCLILADGFFEPHHENGVAIPYFCHQPNDEFPTGDLFLMAGLYNEIDSETSLFSATILTTEANDFFAEVHNKKKRMPLVLANDLYEDWLDDGLNQSQINELMTFGFTNREFKAHPVSRDIYKKGIDTNKPYIVEPVQKDTLF
ncbi:Putative SOS response-associated peptidase YedK [Hyunsoonleella jejuensis]|uniref:Abasic site processing protein n=1 Tax=Hyunsoonleella jejuensis TaxID=419940 RepID=A0A1H9B886_9FLAO|nr:SOS response-associated peptidase [Hyunsoonleella jejuensis]SEP85079.1 Putative SOS response-associated peptidase YedK [Hyunsoonleella jejuensis]